MVNKGSRVRADRLERLGLKVNVVNVVSMAHREFKGKKLPQFPY